MSHYRAVLFDLDGTLLNTLLDLADSMNRVLDRHGFPTHPSERYRYYLGRGRAMLVHDALPEAERRCAMIEACLTLMDQEYSEHWSDKTHIYEGITELLDGLTGLQIPMIIFSNKGDSFVQIIVEHYLNRWDFQTVLGARDGHPLKPDPGVPLEICRGLGFAPEEMVYLGDTNTDMQTARSAGMFAVGAPWGFRPEQELLDNGAQAIIHRPEELLRYF